MLNLHSPYRDKAVGKAAVLVHEGLSRGYTFTVRAVGCCDNEAEEMVWVDISAKAGSRVPEEYRDGIKSLADEVAYLVRA